jgi:intracellular septation protein
MQTKGPTLAASEKPVTEHLIKLGLDLLPLIVFFGANLTLGIYWATGLCMVASVASLALSRALLKRLPIMALVTAAGVLVLGGLTIWLHNDVFIKIKPTIINLMFASALLGGLYFNQLFVKSLLEDAIALTDAGWRKLQFRWGLFFVFLALLNEVIWRSFSTNVWAALKIGNIPLTFVFMLAQIGLFKQFAAAPHKAETGTDRSSG